MRITLERMVGVLGAASKPGFVWQKQFDYNDDALVRLSRMDWDKVPDSDLQDYLLDLAYVELQPDLFRHLFPACLKNWYETLLSDDTAERGEDFHYALVTGQIFEKMLSPQEQRSLVEFFRDGFLDRIEVERGFVYEPGGKTANAWIYRFNTLGIVAPVIREIWEAWWMLDHPGKAVCAVMYASGLVYLRGENPIYGVWTEEEGGGGPHLTEIDSSIFDRAWRNDNHNFLRETLTVDYVLQKLDQAAQFLSDCPEGEMARKIASDAKQRTDVIEIRIGDLLEDLSRVQLDKDRWD